MDLDELHTYLCNENIPLLRRVEYLRECNKTHAKAIVSADWYIDWLNTYKLQIIALHLN